MLFLSFFLFAFIHFEFTLPRSWKTSENLSYSPAVNEQRVVDVSVLRGGHSQGSSARFKRQEADYDSNLNDLESLVEEEEANSPNAGNMAGGSGSGWGQWSPWSACSVTCGTVGEKTRQRTCQNDPLTGVACDGSDVDSETCTPAEVECPKTDSWGSWSEWGECSKTCGEGLKTRERSCVVSDPSLNCPGDSAESQACNLQSCDVKESWSKWSAWSRCSVTCGEGHRSRERVCRDIETKVETPNCPGSKHNKEVCDQQMCSSTGVSVKTVHAVEGQSATLKCMYGKMTPPVTIYWLTPDDKRINHQSSDSQYEALGDTLYIHHASSNMVGMYRCVVHDSKGKVLMGEAPVDVLDCTSKPCRNGGVCQEVQAVDHFSKRFTTFRCLCTAGYNGPRCEGGLGPGNITALFLCVILAAIAIAGLCMVRRFREAEKPPKKLISSTNSKLIVVTSREALAASCDESYSDASLSDSPVRQMNLDGEVNAPPILKASKGVGSIFPKWGWNNNNNLQRFVPKQLPFASKRDKGYSYTKVNTSEGSHYRSPTDVTTEKSSVLDVEKNRNRNCESATNVSDDSSSSFSSDTGVCEDASSSQLSSTSSSDCSEETVFVAPKKVKKKNPRSQSLKCPSKDPCSVQSSSTGSSLSTSLLSSLTGKTTSFTGPSRKYSRSITSGSSGHSSLSSSSGSKSQGFEAVGSISGFPVQNPKSSYQMPGILGQYSSMRHTGPFGSLSPGQSLGKAKSDITAKNYFIPGQVSRQPGLFSPGQKFTPGQKFNPLNRNFNNSNESFINHDSDTQVFSESVGNLNNNTNNKDRLEPYNYLNSKSDQVDHPIAYDICNNNSNYVYKVCKAPQVWPQKCENDDALNMQDSDPTSKELQNVCSSKHSRNGLIPERSESIQDIFLDTPIRCSLCSSRHYQSRKSCLFGKGSSEKCLNVVASSGCCFQDPESQKDNCEEPLMCCEISQVNSDQGRSIDLNPSPTSRKIRLLETDTSIQPSYHLPGDIAQIKHSSTESLTSVSSLDNSSFCLPLTDDILPTYNNTKPPETVHIRGVDELNPVSLSTGKNSSSTSKELVHESKNPDQCIISSNNYIISRSNNTTTPEDFHNAGEDEINLLPFSTGQKSGPQSEETMCVLNTHDPTSSEYQSHEMDKCITQTNKYFISEKHNTTALQTSQRSAQDELNILLHSAGRKKSSPSIETWTASEKYNSAYQNELAGQCKTNIHIPVIKSPSLLGNNTSSHYTEQLNRHCNGCVDPSDDTFKSVGDLQSPIATDEKSSNRQTSNLGFSEVCTTKHNHKIRKSDDCVLKESRDATNSQSKPSSNTKVMLKADKTNPFCENEVMMPTDYLPCCVSNPLGNDAIACTATFTDVLHQLRSQLRKERERASIKVKCLTSIVSDHPSGNMQQETGTQDFVSNLPAYGEPRPHATSTPVDVMSRSEQFPTNNSTASTSAVKEDTGRDYTNDVSLVFRPSPESSPVY